MKQSGLLRKHKLAAEEMLRIGERVSRQLVVDCMCILLHDPDAMGGKAWGEQKIRRFVEALVKLLDEYYEAVTGGVEADYCQEKMDRELRRIFRDELMPFRERYPDVKEITYGVKGGK